MRLRQHDSHAKFGGRVSLNTGSGLKRWSSVIGRLVCNDNFQAVHIMSLKGKFRAPVCSGAGRLNLMAARSVCGENAGDRLNRLSNVFANAA